MADTIIADSCDRRCGLEMAWQVARMGRGWFLLGMVLGLIGWLIAFLGSKEDDHG